MKHCFTKSGSFLLLSFLISFAKSDEQLFSPQADSQLRTSYQDPRLVVLKPFQKDSTQTDQFDDPNDSFENRRKQFAKLYLSEKSKQMTEGNFEVNKNSPNVRIEFPLESIQQATLFKK